MQLIYMTFWLLAGVGLIVFSWATGRPVMSSTFGFPIWPVCFVFAVFNFARWYASRIGAADEKAIRIAEEARRRQARQRRAEAQYDPTFDFNRPPDEPPK
jgi:hypothetical protein